MARIRLIKILFAGAILSFFGFVYAVVLPEVGVEQNKSREAFRKGLELYTAYNYSSSVDYFLESLSYEPDFALARRMLGQSLYFSGQVDEALSEWQVLLEQGYYDPSLQMHMQSLRSFHAVPDPRWKYLKTVTPQQGYRFQTPVFTGILDEGHIYLLARGKIRGGGSLLILNANGHYVENLRRISGPLEMPVGAAFDGEFLWVTDMKSDIIHRMSFQKVGVERVAYEGGEPLGAPGNGEVQFHGPAGICFDGVNFFIVDQGNNRVQKLSRSGEFIQEIKQTRGGSPLYKPFGAACDSESVYISEPDHARVLQFDLFGNFLGYVGEGLLKKPRHLNITGDTLIVTDEERGVILIDRKRRKHKVITSYQKEKEQKKTFARPYAAVMDTNGNLYVADYSAHELLQFVPEQFLYSNLEVWVERVYAEKFPQVGVWVSVKDQLGNYLTNLDSDNFSILENDAGMGRVGAAHLKQYRNQARWVVLMSKSKTMANYLDSANWVSDFFISKLRKKDRVSVISYHNDLRIDTTWTNSRLKIHNALQTRSASDFQDDKVEAAGRSLYRAISELLGEKGRRGVIWITDGNIRPESMTDFTFARLENYAQNNHIPVFIINFENPDLSGWKENRIRLKEFARKTGGEYFASYDASLRNIEEKLRNVTEERYVLTYTSQGKKSWKDQFMEIKVKVLFQGRNGMESSGYFVP